MKALGEVNDCAGKAALMLGPIVYCAERVDNPVQLHRLRVLPTLNTKLEANALHDAWDITVDGILATPGGESNMQVWLHHHD